LFGKKKTDHPAEPDPGTAGEPETTGQTQDRSPEKAARWFEQAQAVHEATHYEYAVRCWLSGIRFDPSGIAVLDGLFKSMAAYREQRGRKGPSRDLLKEFSGRGLEDRYAAALLHWGMKPDDSLSAVRAAEAASKLDLEEPAYWIAERALVMLRRDKKPRKDLFLKLAAVFAKLESFEMAVQAGEEAVRLDPTDGKLAAEIRNLSAQATMSKGGYDQTGQEGGFRANIRDADKQRLLEQSERIVKTKQTIDQLVDAAEEEYRARPDDMPVLSVYAKRLLERGRPEDEQTAYRLLMKGYEQSQQFRFRQDAGDIRLRQARRKLSSYREAAEQNPEDSQATETYEKARRKFLDLEIEEFRLRAEAYPTDLSIKFDLGRRLFSAGRHQDAIPLFQEAQNDVKLRASARGHLARAFQAIDWIDEAIQTYRQALEAHPDKLDDLGMELRYGLMTALQKKAEDERDLEAAREADELASSIAIQQFDYRDIHTRRGALKKLIAELKQGSAA